MAKVAVAQKSKLFYGWWVVLSCASMTLYSNGVFFYGYTTFFDPIVTEFGWTYAETSLASSLQRLQGGIAAPVLGFMTDRLGARLTLALGFAIMGLGFVGLSQVHSLLMYYLVFLVVSFGSSAGSGTVAMVAVSNWFARNRGKANGLMMFGPGFSGLMVPLLVWMIDAQGWRNALIICGVGMLLTCIPLSALVRNRPEQYGLLPDGDSPASVEERRKALLASAAAAQDGAPAGNADFALGQAMRTRAFWLMALALSLAQVATGALFVHEMPYLLKIGIPKETGALIIMAMTLSSNVGRLGFGWLGDIMDKRYVIAFAYLLQFVGLLFWVMAHDLWLLALFAITFGPGYGGAIPVRPSIQADFFGRKAFGTIQGAMLGITTIGGIIGPVFAGHMYDISGDYRFAFVLLALALLPAIPAVLLLKKPALKSQV